MEETIKLKIFNIEPKVSPEVSRGSFGREGLFYIYRVNKNSELMLSIPYIFLHCFDGNEFYHSEPFEHYKEFLFTEEHRDKMCKLLEDYLTKVEKVVNDLRLEKNMEEIAFYVKVAAKRESSVSLRELADMREAWRKK